MEPEPVIDRLIAVVKVSPGISPAAAVRRVMQGKTAVYGMRVVRRAVRAGRLVRTQRPGAPHTGELWIPSDVPEGRALWEQQRLAGLE